MPVYNPLDPSFREDPYPHLARLRSEDPVHWTEHSYCWVLTRYHDIRTVLGDPRFAIALDWLSTYPAIQIQMQEPYNQIIKTQILSADPPSHTRIRSLMARHFTAPKLDALRPVIQRMTDECIARARETGEIDLISGFAYRMPFLVICEMMGIPPAERDPLEHWTHALMRSTDPTPMTIEELAACNTGAYSFRHYFLDLAARRQEDPSQDIFREMVRARDEGKITEEEMVANFILLFCAGHDTVVNLFGNGLLGLFRHRDQLELLRREPSLVKGAVEELLRYDTSIQIARRTALEPVEVGGRWIGAGQYVVCSLGAGNRDPDVFEDPDRLDVTRKNVKPLSFGGGIHYCLGAPLARIEGEIGFRTLLARLPDLELDTLTPKWRQNTTLRGLESLPAHCARVPVGAGL
jgi:cytochrome P450